MIKKIFIALSLFALVFMNAQQASHVVVKGDNPYNISKKYGMTLDDLIKLNPKLKNGNLNIGDTVIVKSKAGLTKPTPRPSTVDKAKLGFIVLKPKQTLYGITKQYHISEDEVRRLNPTLEMKIGEKVILPEYLVAKYADPDAKNQTYLDMMQKKDTLRTNVPTVSEPVKSYTGTGISPDQYVTYTVEEGDTTFGIVNKFGMPLDDLIQLNPQMNSGLKPGMILKIKKVDASYVKKSGDELNVVLMLPFGYQENESEFRNFSLDFLSGAKLAIERNASNGQKLNVKIVDAGNEASFKKYLSKINKNNTDLIIGPFTKSNILEVLEYVKDSKIPVVAPFGTSSEFYDFSNLILVETNDMTYADRIVKEVKAVFSNQKIYIIADANKENANYIKANLQQTLRNPDIVVVSSPSEIQLDINMMTGKSAPVIAVLANNQEKIVNEFAMKMIEISKSTQGNKAFSMYYEAIFDKKVDELSQVSLVYLLDRIVNTEGDFEKEILSSYKEKYCKSPGRTAVFGFDVLNDMLSRENSKGEIFKQIAKPQTQVATKFEFVRIKNNGAYVNTGYRVVRLFPENTEN